jgi:hypothetical protein
MKMSPTRREQKLRKYVHPEAMLKHGFITQAKGSFRWPGGARFAARLIEHVRCTQSEKWRKYAQTRKRRADGPTRMDAA